MCVCVASASGSRCVDDDVVADAVVVGGMDLCFFCNHVYW